ncbi:MAG: AAA family ATPase, partial [Acidimicrobiales bacterium]
QKAIWAKAGWATARATLGKPHPQILVSNQTSLGLLDVFAESFRHRRDDKDLKHIAETLSYTCERATTAGQHTVVACLDALTEHWAFPMPPLDLAEALADLGQSVDGDNDEPEPYPSLAFDAELALAMGFIDNDAEPPRGSKMARRRDRSLVEGASKVEALVSDLAIKAWRRTARAAEILAGDPRPEMDGIEAACDQDRKAWEGHVNAREPGEEHRDMAKRDNAVPGCRLFVARRCAEQAWGSALMWGDGMGTAQALLTGNAITGQVAEVSGDTIVVATSQAVVEVRVDDERHSPDGLQAVVTGLSPGRVALRVAKGAPPLAGSSITLLPKPEDWEQGKVSFNRWAKPAPWTHTAEAELPTASPAGTTPPVPTETGAPAEAEVEVLATQHTGEPAVVVESPPGAGKSSLLVKVAAYCYSDGQRVVVAANTRRQAADLVGRLAEVGANPWLLVSKAAKDQPGPGMGGVIDTPGDIPPDGPVVVVANTAKLRSSMPEHLRGAFDLMALDEAWQVTDADFLPLAGLAKRILLVGDPGQIDPVVTFDPERWRAEPAGPQVPCPEALLARWGKAVHLVRLPATRRFPEDSAKLLQPAFYPDLPFFSVSESTPVEFRDWLGPGRSLAMVEVSPGASSRSDPALAGFTADLVGEVMETCGLGVHEVGVVCAYRSQVASLQAALGPAL